MLKLNPRYVHFVHLNDDEDGTRTLCIEGVNDQNKGYTISLRGLGDTKEEERIRSLLHQLDTMRELTISYKHASLVVICKFVSSFFEPHYKEE